MRCVRPTEPGEGTSSLGALTILVLDVLTYSLIVYKAQVQKWYGKQMIQHVTPTKCSKQTNLGHFNCEFEGFATSANRRYINPSPAKGGVVQDGQTWVAAVVG